MTITCRVDAQSQKYVNGLDRVVLTVLAGTIRPYPQKGQRIPIILNTPQGRYLGGIRDLYICPDLISVKGDNRVSLARILKDNGMSVGDEILLQVFGDKWTLSGN